MKDQQVGTAGMIESIARERQRLMAAVRALGDRATTASVTAEGWTAKDVIAHLVHWAGQLAWALGAPLKVPAWLEAVGGKRLEGDNAWNDLVVEHHRDIPLEGVDQALWQVVAGETYAHWPAHSADIERAAQVTA
jgi:hypothetical protein